MSKRRTKDRRTSKKAEAAPARSRSLRLWLRGVPLLVLGLLVFGIQLPVEAASIPTGPAPTDTCISKDGSASFVLNSGNSTLSVIDPGTHTVTSTINLGLPPGICMDCDWNESMQQVLVGCMNGQILWADPALGTSGVLVNNPAANYTVISADNRAGGIAGFAVDAFTGGLELFTPGGARAPIGPLAIGTEVEMVEKQVDPTAPNPFDDDLLIAGTSALGFTNVVEFNRLTMLFVGLATWPTAPRTATGITTSLHPDVFVSTTVPGGAAGDVLHLNLATFLFTPGPIATYPAGAPTDVSAAGNFLTILEQLWPGPGAVYHVYDVADPLNFLHAGDVPVDPAGTAVTGISTWASLLETLSIDVIYTIHVDGAGSAQSNWGEETRGTWVNPSPLSVTPWTYNMWTGALAGYDPETLVGCGGCAPDEVMGRGPLEGALINPGSGQNVEYATGEEVFTFPVLSVPGIGLDLDIWLTYRSRRDFDYRYGQSWNLNQDVRLETKPNSDLVYHNGYGRLDTYGYQPGGIYVPPLRYDTALVAGGGTTTITNRMGTTSTFDSMGRRTQVQDRYGNTLSYTWSGDQLTGITDTLSRSYTLAYDGTGRLSSVTDFGGRVWTITYDYLGQLRTITTPASTQFTQGRTYWFAYSGNHAQARFRSNLTHVWSAKGDRVQSFVYDTNDMIVKETVGEDDYTFSYDSRVRQTTALDRSGNTTTWSFDAAAVPTKQEVFTKGLRTGEPTSFVTTFSVNPTTGMVDYVVLPRGNRVDYTYDPSLNLTELRRRETNTSTNGPTDIVHGYQYGVFGQRSRYTDPLGNVTTYTLDASGNTTSVAHPTVTSPASQTITETFTYDTLGRITSAADGEGRSVTFSYYISGIQNGYLQSVVRDPTPGLNLTTTFGYDQYGNVTSIQDPRGNTTSITVDAEDYVTQIQAPASLSYKRKVTYDANRSVTKVEVENIDRKGVQDTTTPWIESNFTYDLLGRLTARTVDLTSTTTATTSYEYDGSGNLTTITHPVGNIDEFTWDERHLLFSAVRGSGSAEGSTATFDYDLNGNLDTATDGRSNPTTFEYDLFDRRTKAINALSNYVAFGYDKNSHRTLVEAYDAALTLQARTTNYFDEVNRLWKVKRDRFGTGISTTYPTTIFTRDRGHLLTQVKDPLNNTTTFGYDTAGRRTSITDAALNVRGYTLDANGNATHVSDSEVPATGPVETFVTEFDYDVLNRMTERREIDRLSGTNILTTTYEYDSRSNLTFRTDAEGNPVRWTYDLASRLTKYERALQVGAQIDTFLQSIDEVFAYDANHRLTTLTDDNYNSTTYTYDALSRRTQTTYADTKSITYGYDAADNLSGWTDQNGTVVSNTHDVANRLTARTVTRGTGVLGTTSESYTYDALNRMLTAVDDDYQVEFTHDSVGNLLQDRQGYTAIGLERWKTVSTSYTDAGSVSGIAYPSTFQIGHTRDVIYRMTALVDAGAPANIATFTWQGAARLATTANQNGTGTDYVYDGFRRTASIDHTLVGGGSLHKFEYAYDKVHNRRMEKNTFSATWIATLPAAVQTFLSGRNGKGDVYAYDMAYRMVDARYDVTNPLTEVQNPGTQAFVNNIAYTIDGPGNRSQVATTPPTPPTQVLYANDVVNQYTTVGGTARTHDNNGNLSDDGTYKFGYDFENRLVELRSSTTSALIASYRYDALGRRVEKAINGGVTTRYVLDGVQVVEEFDGSNVWQARYVYEDGIDQPRCMDRADIADVNGNSNTTEVLRFHYHQQALGSVTELTQPTGAVVEWVTYDAYGLPTIRNQVGTTVTQSAVGSPWLYTGREYDPESGLYFYRARTYDPATGRFLQRDPLGYVDGLSAYEYVRSAPTVLVDPRGYGGEAKAARKRADAAEKKADRLFDEWQTLLAELNAAIANRNLLGDDRNTVWNRARCRAKLEPESFEERFRALLSKWEKELDQLLDDADAKIAALEAKVAAAKAKYDKARAEADRLEQEARRLEREDAADDSGGGGSHSGWLHGGAEYVIYYSGGAIGATIGEGVMLAFATPLYSDHEPGDIYDAWLEGGEQLHEQLHGK